VRLFEGFRGSARRSELIGMCVGAVFAVSAVCGASAALADHVSVSLERATDTNRTSATVAVAPTHAAIARAFDETYASFRKYLPAGLCLSAIDRGVRQTKCYGRTAPGSRTVPNENTLFAIGSVTKVLTATLLAVRAEQHKISLTGSVKSFVSPVDGRVNWPSWVTLRDLAQHYAGLPKNPDPNTVYNLHDLFVQAGDCYVAPGCQTGVPFVAPKLRYSYSNLGYELLGQLLGLHDGYRSVTIQPAVSGPMGDLLPPWEQDLDATVVDPLHMTHTKSYISYTKQGNWGYYQAHAAEGLGSNGTIFDPNTRNGAPFTDAAGSIFSSPLDMLKFLDYSMGGHTSGALGQAFPLLYESPKLVPLRPTTSGDHVALGWFVNDGHGYRVLSKGGDTSEGFHSEVAFVEKQRRGVVVLVNSDTVSEASRVKISCKLLRLLPPANSRLPCPGQG
jgi:CubicO group peptidase (beta-lactamase class C family)